jgi:hypothetical protein
MSKFPKPPLLHPANKAMPSIKPVKLPAAVVPGLQKVQQRAHSAWNSRKKSDLLARFPLDHQFKSFLDALMGAGLDAEAHTEKIIARAQEELDKRRHMVSALSEVLEVFRAPDKRMRFHREVMMPARTRKGSGTDIWAAVDAIMASKATKGPLFSLLRFAEEKLGPVTISLGPQGEVGAILGVEAACGVSGLRHHRVAYFESQSVGVGTYGNLTGSFAVGCALGKPNTGNSVSIGAAISGAYGAAAEVSVSLKPVGIHAPKLPAKKPGISIDPEQGSSITFETELIDYEFDGLGVSFGVGTPEIGITTGVTFTRQLCLIGALK